MPHSLMHIESKDLVPHTLGSKSLFISYCLSSHACVHVFATCSADYLGKGQCCNCSTDLSVYFLLCNMKHELTQSTDFQKEIFLPTVLQLSAEI